MGRCQTSKWGNDGCGTSPSQSSSFLDFLDFFFLSVMLSDVEMRPFWPRSCEVSNRDSPRKHFHRQPMLSEIAEACLGGTRKFMIPEKIRMAIRGPENRVGSTSTARQLLGAMRLGHKLHSESIQMEMPRFLPNNDRLPPS